MKLRAQPIGEYDASRACRPTNVVSKILTVLNVGHPCPGCISISLGYRRHGNRPEILRAHGDFTPPRRAPGQAEVNAAVSIARQQLAQRQQELNETQAKRAQASQGYELTSKELAVTRPLINSGAVSEVELLRLERDVSRYRGERGSVLGAVRGTLAHDRLATVLVAVAFVAAAVSLSQFQDGVRVVRSLANFTTVGVILVLVGRYLRA